MNDYDMQAQQEKAYAGALASRGLANGYSGAATAAAPISEINALANRMAAVIEAITIQNSRLQAISDRLLGSSPNKESGHPGQPPRSVPNGHLATFNMGVDEMMQRLSRNDEIINRLDNAI